MRLPSTPRVEFLRTLADEILHHYGRGRTVISVDGSDASGRARVAEDLAEVLREDDERNVFSASLHFFQRSTAEQNAFGTPTPERRYRFGYDYSALRRVLVEPFRINGSAGFVMEHFDPDRDTWIEPTWSTTSPDAILIVEGEFANRPELHDLWLFSILVESGPETAADRLYRAEVAPRNLVDAVVDNTDAAAPRRLFLDSC
ncbi:hypothetical protein [Cryobacterium psychrophilum]|uniref:Uncharacterized protein n=1 Tax=Cryobacterium psychrophilum TaxID=41988 RepID=A0A4Y8KPJ9_9MICO|nr:hypothetical protein [Cryobacterium psychrophilum]TDW29112.1 uridine kinase [Cryobacterium psychrophilum]TFD79679.1 hypothetical protein E3T53_06575 [Cryobacterium psychrophilum]